MNEAKNKAPDFPSSDDIRKLEKTLEKLSYFERRVFLKKKVVSNYPRFFYRYISFEPEDDNSIKKLRDTLINSSLWLSSRAAFNDPFDTKAKFIIDGKPQIIRNRLNELIKKHHPNLGGIKRKNKVDEIMANPTEFQAKLENSSAYSLNGIGACCFSTDPRNLLMWSHYANHHRGIVLQFEVVRDTSTLLKALPVDYSKDYPIINWVKELHKEIRKAFLKKFKTWEYENEWRIVHVFGANTYIDFKPEALTGLVFGCKADNNVKDAVNKILAERTQKDMPSVNTYNAYMDDSKYKLAIKK